MLIRALPVASARDSLGAIAAWLVLLTATLLFWLPLPDLRRGPPVWHPNCTVQDDVVLLVPCFKPGPVDPAANLYHAVFGLCIAWVSFLFMPLLVLTTEHRRVPLRETGIWLAGVAFTLWVLLAVGASVVVLAVLGVTVPLLLGIAVLLGGNHI